MFAACALCLLNSCVFEQPFESKALVPVNPALPGCWNEIPKDGAEAPNRMLVLQHSENEYIVEYPAGGKAMFFRAFAVELAGEVCMQIQLIGTADGAVKPEDRKYHLLKVAVNGNEMEFRTVEPEVLGKDVRDTKGLREAFAAHKDDAGLFSEPTRFRRQP